MLQEEKAARWKLQKKSQVSVVQVGLVFLFPEVAV
jgi:hypothetical protein